MSGPLRFLKQAIFKPSSIGVVFAAAILTDRENGKPGKHEDFRSNTASGSAQQAHDEKGGALNWIRKTMNNFGGYFQPSFVGSNRFAEDKKTHQKHPDVQTRRDLFRYYLSKVPIADDIDVDALVHQTETFPDESIEYAINLAALRSALDGKGEVNMEYLQHSIHHLVCKRARRYLTAYHEAAHALVAHFTPHARSIEKATMASGGPGDVARIIYKDSDAGRQKERHYFADMDVAMAGYVATEKAFKGFNVKLGISNDLQRARKSAAAIIELRKAEIQPPELMSASCYHQQFDTEVEKLLEASFERAKKILDAHPEAHSRITEALLYKSTLDAEELRTLIHST